MNILKSEQYISEKLNIQPVTKDRLTGFAKYKMYKTPFEMRKNFRTGDIVNFTCYTKVEFATFVSYDDYLSDRYSFIRDEFSQNAPSFSEGIFVHKHGGDLSLYCCLSDFDDYLVHYSKNCEVMRVYRRNTAKPSRKSDFTNLRYDNTVLIYEMEYEE